MGPRICLIQQLLHRLPWGNTTRLRRGFYMILDDSGSLGDGNRWRRLMTQLRLRNTARRWLGLLRCGGFSWRCVPGQHPSRSYPGLFTLDIQAQVEDVSSMQHVSTERMCHFQLMPKTSLPRILCRRCQPIKAQLAKDSTPLS